VTALLGIDIGGTWTKLARISATGGLFVRFLTPSRIKANSELTQHLSDLLLTAGPVTHVGMARAPGLDPNGVVCDWPSQPSWVGVPLLKIIEDVTGIVPVHCDDGICAALWEHLIGHWSHQSTTACLSIGTGLGVGIVKEGRILETGDGSLSLGHLPFGNPNLFCRCGKRGCLQTVLSSKALQEAFISLSSTAILSQLTSSFSRALSFLSQTFAVENIILTGGVLERPRERAFLEGVVQRSKNNDIKIFISQTPSLSALAGSIVLSFSGNECVEMIESHWLDIIQREIESFHRKTKVYFFV